MSLQFTNKQITWGLFTLAIIAYLLPWTVNVGNSLTMGAYDFAEWLSKRPFDDTSYNTVMIMRGQLILLTALIMFSLEQPSLTKSWWAIVITGVILLIAQLPAPNAILDTNDVNRQQQVYLTGISFIIFLVSLTGFFSRYRNISWLIIAIIGIASTIYALTNAISMMQAYQLPAQIGVGAILFILTYIILGMLAIRGLLKSFRG